MKWRFIKRDPVLCFTRAITAAARYAFKMRIAVRIAVRR